MHYKQIEHDFPEAHKKLTLRELRGHSDKHDNELKEYGMGKENGKNGLGMNIEMSSS